ncbi:Hsp20/alpha crystallin family protein [Cooperia oncophora]
MSVCILPWTTETAILPCVLDDIFGEIEQFETATSSCSCSDQEKTVVGTDPKQATQDDSKLSFSLNVSKFKPDELKVTIDGRNLTVTGEQEFQEGSSYSARSFLQQWTLPEDVNLEQIRSTLTDSGQLIIDVPKSEPAGTIRNMPIQTEIDLD